MDCTLKGSLFLLDLLQLIFTESKMPKIVFSYKYVVEEPPVLSIGPHLAALKSHCAISVFKN